MMCSLMRIKLLTLKFSLLETISAKFLTLVNTLRKKMVTIVTPKMDVAPWCYIIVDGWYGMDEGGAPFVAQSDNKQ